MGAPDLRGRRLGGFELIELIGDGAFGSVWRARQLRLGRDVAVKVLDPSLARNPDVARRFEREGRAAASLDHPNIVPVFGAGEDDDLVYLAMRLVDGETIADRLAREGVLDAEATLAVLEPVAAALDHAHAVDLVHRDVKPSNILVDDDNVWLADFGIAATTQEIGQYTTGSIGTAEYMAPEQASVGEIDHRADLYALGCVAFHCLEGRPPYPGADLVAVLMAHVNEPVPEVGNATLDGFFATALAKAPDDRFSSGAELTAAMRQALGRPDSPAAVQPVGIGRAWVGRAALVIGLVAAALVGVAVSLFLFGGGDDEPDSAAAPAATPEATPEPAIVETGGDDPAADDSTQPIIASGGFAAVASNLIGDSMNVHTDIQTEALVSGHVLPVLVRVNPDFTLEPDLAADLPILVSDDPFTVRWMLRPDAVWDDGTPITARDVEATYEYLTDPASGALNTFLYDQIDTFEVVSDTELLLRFVEPVGPWRVMFSTNHPIIKAQAYQEHLDAGGTPDTFLQGENEPIPFSGGPFSVVGFEAGDRVLLRRNADYWGQPAILDTIEILSYDSVDDQLDALDSGTVDLVYVELPGAAQLTTAQQLDGVVAMPGTSSLSFELQLNTTAAPLDDVLVRRAIGDAIDRAAMATVGVQPVTGAAAAPLDSLVYLPRQPEYEPAFAAIGDRENAARLLDEAGWVLDGEFRAKEGETLVLEVMYRDTTVDELNGANLAGVVQQQFRSVGIETVLAPVNGADFLERRQSGDYQVRIDFAIANSDPAAARLRYGSESCPPTITGCDGDPRGFNFNGYGDAELDQLLDAADIEPDADARAAIFHRIDAILAEDLPALPLYEGPSFVAHVDDLTNIDLAAPRGGPLSTMHRWAYTVELE